MVAEEMKAAIQPQSVAEKQIVEKSDAEKKGVDEEEFFERELFEDVLEMRSLRKVSEVTAIEFPKLQDQVYQCLYQLYQKNRGVFPPEKSEIVGIFELFFKNYYQHFRTSMEELFSRCPPVKVAYFLGKSSDKILKMLDQTILDIEKELA